MEKTKEEEKLDRLMKIIETMNINSNYHNINISREELIKMRNELKNKKNNDSGNSRKISFFNI